MAILHGKAVFAGQDIYADTCPSSTIDRRRFRDIERLALRDAFHDVKHHDVAELFQADEVGERAADLAGTDQRNFVSRHGGKTLELLGPRGAAKRDLSSLL